MTAVRTLFCFSFLFLSGAVLAQDRQISIRNTNNGKSIRLIEGDYARFTVQNSFSMKGQIEQLHPDHMVVQSEKLLYPDIWKIRTTNPHVVGNGVKLAAAGVLYGAIVLTNGLINNDVPLVSTGTYWVSGSLITAGVVIISLGVHNYATKDKWKIEYIDFTKLNQP
jgi:hypothetical protein